MIFRQIIEESIGLTDLISCLIMTHILPLITRLSFCLSSNWIRFSSLTLTLLPRGLTLVNLILRQSLPLALIPRALTLVLVARAFAESVI